MTSNNVSRSNTTSQVARVAASPFDFRRTNDRKVTARKQ